jgi:glutamate 5-kinase
MLSNAKRIVIKIGSSLIIDEANTARKEWLASLAADVAALRRTGKEIIVVTSGAVALGRVRLGFEPGAKLLLEERQAAAASGQIELFSAWRDVFNTHGITVAQLLLTAEDSIHRRRYLNARNTIDTLFECGAIPIINENDTVATAELRFGDNDRLAARVAQMAGADVLVLFSDIDGLYTDNPRTNPSAVLVAEVTDINPQIEGYAGGAGSSVGTGGMATKIAAAKIATAAGCHMIIAKGLGQHPLKALQEDGPCTRFIAQVSPLSARKNWIAGSLHPAGTLTVDAGAASALMRGKSLLPAGVTVVDGEFDRGDCVLIQDSNNVILGRGLIAYDSKDARLIRGKQSSEIEAALGFKRRDVLVHRDDMVLQ